MLKFYMIAYTIHINVHVNVCVSVYMYIVLPQLKTRSSGTHFVVFEYPGMCRSLYDVSL